MLNITVKPTMLRGSASKVRTISSAIRGRDLNVSISESRGQAATQLTELAASMKELGSAFAAVMEKTARSLDYAANKFEETDAAIGSKY